MVRQTNLVIIGVTVGLTLGILISCLLFFGIRWCRKRSHLSRSASEPSLTTLPIRTNGPGTSIDFSASITSSIGTSRSDNPQKNSHFTWWNNQNKDRFASASGILKYSYKELQKATQNFTTTLGQGSFGTVYKATISTGEVVAVKVLANNSKQGEREFQTEVSLLGRLHHRNLVNLLGYCVDKGQRILVYQFMSNGSLASILYDEEKKLSWDDRLQIAVDISHGIEYLHEGAVPPVIHRDLKSPNILLDGSMRAKVADFGLSKEERFDGRNSGLKGTYGYMDPAYISSSKLTTKSDIYSFGVILFELITAIHPHQNLMEYVNLAAMEHDGIDEILDKQLVGKCNVLEVRQLAKIAHKCLHKSPKRRPSIGEVSQGISRIKQRRLRNVMEDNLSFANSNNFSIQSHFQGPFYRWSETPEDVREYWWKLFGDKIAWDPRDHVYIKKTFQTRGAKRLSDMLSKVRKKGTRPHWICEEAWKGLNVHWEGEAFIKISSQNKTNRNSCKGGAVHTTGRKAHVDVALSMAQELGRSVDPDELFLATHKRKSGNWVDDRSQTTYKQYHDRLKEVQTQNGKASQNGMQEIDGATKLELWKEVAGGKSRGRCYGTADFALNLRRGVTSLTQESREPYSGGCDHAMHLEAIDAVRKEAAAAHQEAAAARQEAATARQEAAESKQHYQLLEEQLRKVMKHMKALERQSAGAFTSVSQARRARQSAGAFTSVSQARRGHPRYDDDHSLDEFLADRRRKKHLALRRHPHYDDDYSLDEIFPNRRQKHQAHKRHYHYDDEDSLDSLLPKQHQAERGHTRYDDEDSLDEVLPKQRQAKRGRSHYDDDDSLDEVLPKQHHAKRGHPHYDDDDDLPDGVLPKQQAKKRHPHYDNDEDSLHEDLPKNHQAKRGRSHYDVEDNLLDGVLPKQPQAKKRHPHYDNDGDSLHEDLPKNHQAERGQPRYDDDDDLPDGVLPKQRQAKKLHPHYDNDEDSLHEDLPKNHQAKRGRPLYDDTDSLDEVLPARRRRHYRS